MLNCHGFLSVLRARLCRMRGPGGGEEEWERGSVGGEGAGSGDVRISNDCDSERGTLC